VRRQHGGASLRSLDNIRVKIMIDPANLL